MDGSLVGRDSAPVVAHADDDVDALPPRIQLDVPSGLGVLGRVDDQIRNHLRDSYRIPSDDKARPRRPSAFTVERTRSLKKSLTTG